MAPKAAKNKAVDAAAKAEEPPAKKAKPEEDAEAAKKPAEPEEKETDAPKAKGPLLEKAVGFDPSGYSLNVVPVMGGNVLMSATDGGMQFLLGGARANVGLKAGRYLYEAKVVEVLAPDEGKQHHGQRNKVWGKQMVRLGFSTEGSSLILGDGDDCIAFDGDGSFIADGKKSPPKHSSKFWRDKVVGVLLNLDPKSDNAHTVSLFRDGVRVTEPMPLPDKLKGKPLFPHVTFRNVTVQMNFGPNPMKPLPFKCLMVQGASAADTKAAPAPAAKSTVVFPVGMPDEGTFDVVDAFLEKNPSFTELSDRKVQEWAVKSGAWKGNKTASNDKPPFDFGMEMLDNRSACHVIGAMAHCVPRDYVVMEVRGNLCPEDRKANLQKFSSAKFKRVARVAMGKPPKEYIAKVHKTLLEQKQAKLELEWNKRKAEKAKQKAFKLKQKEIAEKKKKAEEDKKKREEEAKAKKEEGAKAKKAAEEAKKAAEEDKKEGDKKEEAKEGDTKVEESETKEDAKEEPKTEEAKEEPKEEPKDEPKEEPKEEPKVEEAEEEEEEPDEPMPVAELTEEEKAMCFKPVLVSDLAPRVLSSSFAKFSIPDKSEGFDEIIFEWEKEAASARYLKDRVLKLKTTSRIDDLVPGEWFKTTSGEFEKLQAECEEKTKTVTAAQKDDPPADIMAVEDVHNVGDGTPLYKLFVFEDWVLLKLRCELFLLAVSYKKDVDDPERPGIHEDNLAFYYGKYFKKGLVPKHYGKDTLVDLLTMIKDTVSIDPENGVLTLKIEDDTPADHFVKMQEKSRRDRQRRFDAGDETARLDFSALKAQKEAAEKQAALKAQQEKELAEKQKAAAAAAAAAGGAAGGAAAGALSAGKVTGKMVPPKGMGDKGKGAAGPKGAGKAWQPGKFGCGKPGKW
ncbi:unnamed protein product [Prorocentrum cordatum]|uniref:B30.2/SPRY domain-containing protein n=1 Tax=Prorocentrum cordatum TaxID=2364126 RepID=A0ABN9TSF0_9DINO|nr:unnamed protein product [Polarella glacialis]